MKAVLRQALTFVNIILGRPRSGWYWLKGPVSRIDVFGGVSHILKYTGIGHRNHPFVLGGGNPHVPFLVGVASQ